MLSHRRGAILLAAVFLCNLLGTISQSLAAHTRPSIGQCLAHLFQAALFLAVLIGHTWARWLTVTLGSLAALVLALTLPNPVTAYLAFRRS